MKLYQGDLSPFASRVRLQLYAKGLDVDKVQIMAPPGGTGSAEFKAINPTGKIPALDTGTRVLPESEVICEFLEDTFPETPLRPAMPNDRAQVRLLARFVDMYLYPRMAPLYGQVNATTRDQQAVDAGLPAVDEALTILERLFGDGGYQGGAYAVGNSLTLADCALVPGLFFCNLLLPVLGRAQPFAKAPQVGKYWAQVQSIPPCARVLKECQAALGAAMANR